MRSVDTDKVWTTPEGKWVSDKWLQDHEFGYGDVSVACRELIALRANRLPEDDEAERLVRDYYKHLHAGSDDGVQLTYDGPWLEQRIREALAKARGKT